MPLPTRTGRLRFPVLAFIASKETVKDGETTRRYRAVHDNKAVVWNVSFDKNKKIKSLEPKLE